MSNNDKFNTYILGYSYFRLTYYDDKFVYPKIETVIFLGKGEELREKLESKKGFLYFQDAESYARYDFLNSLDYKIDADEVIIFEINDKLAKSMIFDCNGLIHELIHWNKKLNPT